MALSNEDHKDVKKAMGKALANKVAKVTRDNRVRKLSVESKTLGRHYSELGPKTDNGFKPERKLKINALPHWSQKDFETARRQRESKQDSF
jgi:hypothetical protein